MTERRQRLAERNLVDFFKANPHEELTIEDAAMKFGTTEMTARCALSKLSGAGIVERVSVYRIKAPEERSSSIGVRVAEALKAGIA